MLEIMGYFLIIKILYYFQDNNNKVDQFNLLTFFFSSLLGLFSRILSPKIYLE